ncbi:spore cortex biosynthesis protein YabQ [Shouchella lehensis]|uniref:Uncharacterized protein n=1 Tax=Shouchella lehensis G1 TaxID=1246626 RepID=A0A060M0A8_9BACI|nr:hypothetical protein [Shouchella lehensis]AIC95455.1 hypothetical protein BleG1_2891 [Shouchella lehensis G1]
MEKNKEKFPHKKDFIYWVIILVAIIIFLFVWRINNHEEVVSQISLVGSVSSILLALIAIGYAFFQTNSTQLESKKMLELLEKMDIKVDELDEIKQGLSNMEGEFSNFKKNSQFQSTKLYEAIKSMPEKIDISPIYNYMEKEMRTKLTSENKEEIEKLYKDQFNIKIKSLFKLENELEAAILNYIDEELEVEESLSYRKLNELTQLAGLTNDERETAIEKFLAFGLIKKVFNIRKLKDDRKVRVPILIKNKEVKGIYRKEDEDEI